MQHINALAALERWDEVKDVLTSERFPLEPVFQHMYLATARTRLGETTAATNEWKRALEVANTPEKLLALANYAEQNRANDMADGAYSAAIKLAPMNRTAYAGRLRAALASDHTSEAQTIAAEIAQLWPDDAAARNQDAYLRLCCPVRRLLSYQELSLAFGRFRRASLCALPQSQTSVLTSCRH